MAEFEPIVTIRFVDFVDLLKMARAECNNCGICDKETCVLAIFEKNLKEQGVDINAGYN
jgi:hypothetical protein